MYTMSSSNPRGPVETMVSSRRAGRGFVRAMSASGGSKPYKSTEGKAPAKASKGR